ncbi:unnamed protein product [Fraxinus pennsylvanica]|uniref:Reverse transcriptase n=1 Tax=Fraxinus pennsylvanica TaxID=56036 RepID=A0AAD2A6S3_9LAMI|nr:unnamed protein product [Fraxinus pennsylvanica]
MNLRFFDMVLPVVYSDHNPLLIKCNNGPLQLKPNASRLFRYEAVWSGKQECKDIIDSSWSHQGGQSSSFGWFKEGIRRCREKLEFWARSNAREARKELKVNLQKLPSLQNVNKGDLNGRITDIQYQVDALLAEEEIKWRQRSKQMWLKCGDKNTTYFHKCASLRKQRNTIRSILNDRGEMSTTQDEIGNTFQLFYQHLFSSSHPTGIEEVIQDLETMVSSDMNDQLQRSCTDEEVKRALFEMDPMSSPGPDGFSADFYQDN